MKKRRGLALGCGGSLGYAWSLCALRRLEENTGWDPREAEVLVGTSAGSVLAALLASGKSTSDLLERQRRAARGGQRASSKPDHLPPSPSGRPLSLRLFGEGLLGKQPPFVALTGLLPEGRLDASRFVASLEEVVAPGAWVSHSRCWAIAMDIETGARVAFGREGPPREGDGTIPAPRASIHEAVAASCAVPGWIAPVTIEGRRYLDGGAVSSASVDLLEHEDLDEIVVVSPMTSSRFAPPTSIGQAAERVMRAIMSRRLDREIAQVEARGTRVIRIEPTARDLALMGPNFMDARRIGPVLDAWYPAS